MPIMYKVEERYSHFASEEKRKYYLIAKSWGTIERETLIEEMVRHKSLTEAEASTAIDYLFEAIPRFLALGYTVNLHRLGSFAVSIQSEGSETRKDADKRKIKSVKIHFTPGKEFRESIENAPIEAFPEKEENKPKTSHWTRRMKQMKSAGLEEGKREQTISTVRSCLKENLPIETISRITNLSAEEIKALS